MNKKFDGGTKTIAKKATNTNLEVVDTNIATPTNLEVKKWTLSGDALVTYNFINSVPDEAGVQAGVNFVSTNIYDMLAPFASTQEELDSIKDKMNVSGGALVAGAFVNYDGTIKLSLAADGYIGLLKFGDLASAFSNAQSKRKPCI